MLFIVQYRDGHVAIASTLDEVAKCVKENTDCVVHEVAQPLDIALAQPVPIPLVADALNPAS